MTERVSTVRGLLKALGPGILFAGAAIGGSHLIQSTRAGADYYFDLVWIILLVNLFKYPFFEYGHRYTVATGESILEGYNKQGTWYLATFAFLSTITGVINYIALSAITAGLVENIIGIELNNLMLILLVMASTVIILLIGKFQLLDKTMKLIIVVLSLSTIIAFFMAAMNAPPIQEVTNRDIWTPAGIAFLIALMGWMPAPVEASTWTSLWAMERTKQTGYKPTLGESLADFHIGYIGTAIMALFFVGLGAFIMYGSGIEFSPKGEMFAAQLVSLYTKTLGNWSAPIIKTAAVLTIFSSLITVIDAYPRSITSAILILKPEFIKLKHLGIIITISIATFAAIVLLLLPGTMKDLLQLATIIAFLTAPVFSILNYNSVTSKYFPSEFKPKLWLRILSILGIAYLSIFGLIYLYSLL